MKKCSNQQTIVLLAKSTVENLLEPAKITLATMIANLIVMNAEGTDNPKGFTYGGRNYFLRDTSNTDMYLYRSSLPKLHENLIKHLDEITDLETSIIKDEDLISRFLQLQLLDSDGDFQKARNSIPEELITYAPKELSSLTRTEDFVIKVPKVFYDRVLTAINYHLVLRIL